MAPEEPSGQPAARLRCPSRHTSDHQVSPELGCWLPAPCSPLPPHQHPFFISAHNCARLFILHRKQITTIGAKWPAPHCPQPDPCFFPTSFPGVWCTPPFPSPLSGATPPVCILRLPFNPSFSLLRIRIVNFILQNTVTPDLGKGTGPVDPYIPLIPRG